MHLSRLHAVFTRARRFFNTLMLLAGVNFIFSISLITTTFINSSFLGQFFSPEAISLLYIASSVLAIATMIAAPFIVGRLGVWKTLIISILLLQILILFFGFAATTVAAGLFFMLRTLFARMVPFLLDLYVEAQVKDESHTGNARGSYITGFSLGAVLGPIIASLLVFGTNYTPAYIFSAIALTPLLWLVVVRLKKLTPTLPEPGHFIRSFKALWTCQTSVRYTMFIHLIFRATTIIYTIYVPLFLVQAGYSWQVIGIIIAIALIPYLVLEYPLGTIADKFLGEKELMITGLFILSFSTAALSLVPVTYLTLWILPFIFTRVGAAFIEISTESYFFKQVTEKDSALIGIFRMISPLAVITAPVVALVFLPITDLQWLFGFIGATILIGVPLAQRIQDSR
ncbi:MAG: MFS transporter [Patescibacteria group bacterium UBA2163]